MTTTSMPPIILPGDACPHWCSGAHIIDRTENDGSPTRLEDAGVAHRSGLIDAWHPNSNLSLREPVTVYVDGYRHDNPDQTSDWPDSVRAEGTATGSTGEVSLEAPDARRLGGALLTAAVTIEHSPHELRGPAEPDVDTLRGLLDLMENFADNDQRARYLLTSDWMRDRGMEASARLRALSAVESTLN